MKTMSKLCFIAIFVQRNVKKDGGKLDYDACAETYQSQTVKKNEKSLKLDGTTSSVIFFGQRGKIKTFSIISRIDFPFHISQHKRNQTKRVKNSLQSRVIFVVSTISTNPYVKTCQTWYCVHYCKKLMISVLALFLPWSRDLPNMAVVRKSTGDLL